MNDYFYLTIDPVNADTAEGLAERAGLPLAVIEPRDLPRLTRGWVIIDWDCLDETIRARVLSSARLEVVAIHGYDLDDRLSGFLPLRNVVCSRRLDATFFGMLVARSAAA